MVVALGAPAAVLVSCVAWALIGLGSGYGWHRVPLARLSTDTWLTRPREWEDEGRWYRRRLRIHRWKDRLPEKGDLFDGGFAKRHLGGREPERLRRFAVETRRAEMVHWCNLGAGPIFLVWCPPLLGGVMIAFGVVAHLPFIAVQRYNRQRLEALADRGEARDQRSTR